MTGETQHGECRICRAFREPPLFAALHHPTECRHQGHPDLPRIPLVKVAGFKPVTPDMLGLEEEWPW